MTKRDKTTLGAAAKPFQASSHNGPVNRSADWLHQARADLGLAEVSAAAGHHEHGQQAWAMPVRSLTQSVLRWPEPEHPGLERVGVFGSYGRGEASVGSDLDLLLIDRQATGPKHQRLLGWPLEELPLSCDALVLTPREHHDLLAGNSAMATALARDSRWLWQRRNEQRCS
jgi:UTP:GlnB (protein PII) uridylyltransferase